jgi:hypothetical protein
MDKWFKVILPDKDPYHNRGRDQMRKKGGPEFECLCVLPNLGRSSIKKIKQYETGATCSASEVQSTLSNHSRMNFSHK